MKNATKCSVVKIEAAQNPCLGCNGCSAPEPKPAPTIIVTPGISAAHDHGLEFDHADLLVLGKVTGAGLGAGPLAFDAHNGGAVSREINAQKFHGELGELLHFELPQSTESARSRHIAVIGLGREDAVTRQNMCQFFNHALSLACKVNARTMLVPVFPMRSSAQSINLRGTGAILRCIVDERSRRGTLSNLEEIQLLCAPQAKRHLEQGLAVEHTLCTVCRAPNLA